jgi:hypothetical protein
MQNGGVKKLNLWSTNYMSSSHHVKFLLLHVPGRQFSTVRVATTGTSKLLYCTASPSSNFISTWHVVIFRCGRTLYSIAFKVARLAQLTVTAVISCHEDLPVRAVPLLMVLPLSLKLMLVHVVWSAIWAFFLPSPSGHRQ